MPPSLRHGDQYQEYQADDKQHQWHQHTDQSEWTEAWDSHKLQIPGLSYNWWGFQAWDALQDSTDNSSIDRLKPVWDDRSISLSSKIRLMRSPVTSIFLCACESWSLTAQLKRRIQAMEMRCYHKILPISYKDYFTNKEVSTKIRQASRQHEDLLTIVKRLKLQWHGHVSRSSGLVKTTLQGTVKGERRQGNRRRLEKTTYGNGHDRSSASPRGQWRTGKKMEETVCEIIFGALTTLAIKV